MRQEEAPQCAPPAASTTGGDKAAVIGQGEAEAGGRVNALSPMPPAVKAPGEDKEETELSPSVSLEVVIRWAGGRQASRGTGVCVNAPLPLPLPPAAASAMEQTSLEP